MLSLYFRLTITAFIFGTVLISRFWDHDCEINVTYIGGPTALLEWDDIRLLTDPTFDPTGQEYQYGPVVLKKLAGPALSPESLGRVDAVLLSHDHHLDNLDHSGRKFLPKAKQVITTTAGAERLGGNVAGLSNWQSTEIARDSRVLRITGMQRKPISP